MNIRAISLSYGTNSTQPYLVDPLAYAAEQAWKAGIVVVAAAGNHRYQRGAAPRALPIRLRPYLIAVGGSRPRTGTGTPLGDDGELAGCAPPAPASRTPRRRRSAKAPLVTSARTSRACASPAPSSTRRTRTGGSDSHYFRGSGTSEATALTAGAIALILDKYPQMTPDQVKAFIGGRRAQDRGASTTTAQGAGEIDLEPPA